MIETGQLTKAYGDVAVVDGVSLQIPAGGVTAIIGPNGACLLYTSPSPRDKRQSRMPSSA